MTKTRFALKSLVIIWVLTSAFTAMVAVFGSFYIYQSMRAKVVENVTEVLMLRYGSYLRDIDSPDNIDRARSLVGRCFKEAQSVNESDVIDSYRSAADAFGSYQKMRLLAEAEEIVSKMGPLEIITTLRGGYSLAYSSRNDLDRTLLQSFRQYKGFQLLAICGSLMGVGG